ncbi:MAG: alpha-1,4-glucan--maltose-1-phosphate maltosyltransferase, partial [Chthoniobacterales bacterium]
AIENITPILNGGKYPIKRIPGEEVVVEADVFKDGHDVIGAVLKWRTVGESRWHETPMHPVINDRWKGVMALSKEGHYEYTIEAWGDSFLSWREEIRKKVDGGIVDLTSEALEGAALVRAAATRCGDTVDRDWLLAVATELPDLTGVPLKELACNSKLVACMAAYDDRSLATTYEPALRVWVDRRQAAVASWYEFFPRSAEGKADSGSTFRDCLGRIDDAKAMGFDVIYFPPIHPIGETNRKGPNNTLNAAPGDPGVPYAIGNFRQGINGGGHKDVAPELGTLEDFDWLVGEIHQRGMEIALDFAINCSPDHPYVAAHPDWFFKRPDGSIKYAENPPKKYEDVYPLNFHCAEWQSLWQELRDVLLFWSARGVRIFRVDNPHTKPIAFWEWVIGEVLAKFPDVIFLSEAFTRPKMMQILAKVGFTQSYTYFTWRNTKPELTEYLTELTQSEMAEYFRANFFANTPDILPEFLQKGGRPAFLIRSVLAATLAPVYGIYSGFELCENAAIPGKEEYFESEKYQFKRRDWNGANNIKAWITALNRARSENRALQEYRNLLFHNAENDQVLFYSKITSARDNIILVAVSLDPFSPQSAWLDVPVELFGWADGDAFEVEDLLSGNRFLWRGRRNYVSLSPNTNPAHVFKVRRCVGRSQGRPVFL